MPQMTKPATCLRPRQTHWKHRQCRSLPEHLGNVFFSFLFAVMRSIFSIMQSKGPGLRLADLSWSIQGTPHPFASFVQHMRVNHGRGHVIVPEQFAGQPRQRAVPGQANDRGRTPRNQNAALYAHSGRHTLQSGHPGFLQTPGRCGQGQNGRGSCMYEKDPGYSQLHG